MIRKCHNRTLQTNPQDLKEETQNTKSRTTARLQFKKGNQISLPQQDDCNGNIEDLT